MSDRKLIQPLPWTVGAGIAMAKVLDANGMAVLHGVTRDEAEFIARACNSHQALVEALDRLLGALNDDLDSEAASAWDQARAALEQATHV